MPRTHFSKVILQGKFTICHFRALEISCNNAAWPDIHGHYREAQFTQTKHHWWWKANWIFDKVSATKYFTGESLYNQLLASH